MASLYFHIPFCKSRCLYCDFYSTTSLSLQDSYCQALTTELKARLSYLGGEQIDTVYFGGGTPSLLTLNHLQQLLTAVREHYPLAVNAEITLEMNAGDATNEYLTGLRQLGFNRLSIGVQSFNDDVLRFIGRRHTSQQAREAVRKAQQAGFDNISIDIIYAVPDVRPLSLLDVRPHTLLEVRKRTLADIDEALGLNIQHISTYNLTYEDGTPLTRKLHAGEIQALDEDTENELYDLICDRLTQAGFEHYEVSNFARKGYRSRHNSAYWNDTPYLGVGAAAHSYDRQSRQWNIADLQQYIHLTQANTSCYEREELTPLDRYNERVMLQLRRTEGIDLNQLTPQERAYCLDKAKPFLLDGLLQHENNRLCATRKGINILNIITEKLMQ